LRRAPGRVCGRCLPRHGCVSHARTHRCVCTIQHVAQAWTCAWPAPGRRKVGVLDARQTQRKDGQGRRGCNIVRPPSLVSEVCMHAVCLLWRVQTAFAICIARTRRDERRQIACDRVGCTLLVRKRCTAGTRAASSTVAPAGRRRSAQAGCTGRARSVL